MVVFMPATVIAALLTGVRGQTKPPSVFGQLVPTTLPAPFPPAPPSTGEAGAVPATRGCGPTAAFRSASAYVHARAFPLSGISMAPRDSAGSRKLGVAGGVARSVTCTSTPTSCVFQFT